MIAKACCPDVTCSGKWAAAEQAKGLEEEAEFVVGQAELVKEATGGMHGFDHFHMSDVTKHDEGSGGFRASLPTIRRRLLTQGPRVATAHHATAATEGRKARR